MAQELIVKNIKESEVAFMTEVFKKAKATAVVSIRQNNGKFTLKVSFPDAKLPKP